MNLVQRLQAILQKKTHHRVGDAKAKRLLALLENQVKSGVTAQTISALLSELEELPVLPEWILSQVLIHETFFFRHPEQYAQIRAHLLARKSKAVGIKALCVGASSGQEAYSLAMVFESCGLSENDATITAIDIDPHVIQIAKQGHYSIQEIERTPQEYQMTLQRHLKRVTQDQKTYFAINENIKKRVRFVVGDAFRLAYDNSDLILIRNFLIYFPVEERKQLLSKLSSKLNPQGLLFIGSGELFPANFKQHHDLELQGPTLLERKAG